MATTTKLPTQRSAGVLVLACLILFIDGYDLFALGTIGPSLLHDPTWNAGPTTLGTLGSVTAIGMPFGSILAGWCADRWGRRGPLTIAVAWISVSMLAAALAPTMALLGTARFATGIGVGGLAPLVGALVSDHAPARRRTLHLAVAIGSIGIGGTASALLGRFLLPQHDFQLIFLIGAVPILLAPFIWRMLPATPSLRSAPKSGREQVGLLLAPSRRTGTILLWTATFASMTLVYSTTAWLPTVMMRNGYNLSSSLEFSIAFTFGAAAGGVALAVYADRGHLKVVTALTFLLAALALLVLSTNQPRPVLLVASALAGLGALGCQNMIIACMSSFYPQHLRGAALGYGLGIGRLGAIAGPSYLSLATALFTSPRIGFFAFMIPAIIGSIAVAMLPRAFVSTSQEEQPRD
ncbi:MFS transporter [Nocardia sp. NPDC058705]|uniref:MFS transporter n=1 Tax=Nocardia sp. NPDC058705 TaxID=3346609 RepID=UPI0036CC1515